MRAVPPSRREDLHRGGAAIRVYRDTRTKLKELAVLRGTTLAVAVDEITDAALKAEYDRRQAALGDLGR